MNAPDMIVVPPEADTVLPEHAIVAVANAKARVTFNPEPNGSMAPLYAALAAAQGLYEPIVALHKVTVEKTKGGTYSFWYADLEEILAKTRQALSKNGLSLIQIPHGGPQSGVTLLTVLAHASGASIESELDLPPSEDIKEFGSYITYCRRYIAAPLLGVASTELQEHNGSEPGDGDGSDSPNPPRFPTHPALDAAKTLPELSKAMNAIPIDERRTLLQHYEQRQRDIKKGEAK
jgi:hypothetical protein